MPEEFLHEAGKGLLRRLRCPPPSAAPATSGLAMVHNPATGFTLSARPCGRLPWRPCEVHDVDDAAERLMDRSKTDPATLPRLLS